MMSCIASYLINANKAFRQKIGQESSRVSPNEIGEDFKLRSPLNRMSLVEQCKYLSGIVPSGDEVSRILKLVYKTLCQVDLLDEITYSNCLAEVTNILGCLEWETSSDTLTKEEIYVLKQAKKELEGILSNSF